MKLRRARVKSNVLGNDDLKARVDKQHLKKLRRELAKELGHMPHTDRQEEAQQERIEELRKKILQMEGTLDTGREVPPGSLAYDDDDFPEVDQKLFRPSMSESDDDEPTFGDEASVDEPLGEGLRKMASGKTTGRVQSSAPNLSNIAKTVPGNSISVSDDPGNMTIKNLWFPPPVIWIAGYRDDKMISSTRPVELTLKEINKPENPTGKELIYLSDKSTGFVCRCLARQGIFGIHSRIKEPHLFVNGTSMETGVWMASDNYGEVSCFYYGIKAGIDSVIQFVHRYDIDHNTSAGLSWVRTPPKLKDEEDEDEDDDDPYSDADCDDLMSDGTDDPDAGNRKAP